MQISIDWLKNNCEMIHYFGLGFIQLKVDKTTRLHFYTPDLPAIVSEEDIHNHRYNFKSEIIYGSLHTALYEVVPGDTHVMEDESCQVGTKPTGEPKRCGVSMLYSNVMLAGSEYCINYKTFHRVKAYSYCLTMLTRTGYQQDYAQVIRPVGAEPICPFSQKIDEDTLWEIVRAMTSEVAPVV